MYIQVMKQPGLKDTKGVVSLPCACANLRRAARIVTQRYDHILRPAGMKATQFTLLQALAVAGNVSQGKLGELLGLDSTTLTRTLALLRKRGWIHTQRGEDRRELRLALTSEGKRKYRRTLRYWHSAQKQLRTTVGEAGWKHLIEATTFAAAIAQRR